MEEEKALKVFKFIGLWDLLITLPFCLPFINKYLIILLRFVHTYVSPGREFPDFSNLHLLFVQLFGFMCVLWGLVRIHKPQLFLAVYDFIGRIIVCLIFLSFSLDG